jgi:hypothetical protein
MEHAEAIRSMASDKYLLNELAPEQREQFEEHFFGCPDCALEVRAGATFLEHSKVVLAAPVRETPVVAASRRPDGWRAWLRPAIAVPVVAVLLMVIGYQNLSTFSKSRNTIAELRAPQILPSASLVNVRGDKVPLIAVRPNQSFLLFVDIPADSRFASYVCDEFSPSGTLEWSVPVSSETAKDTLSLQVPPGPAALGVHTLAVRGITSGNGSSVLTRYTFELQAQK